VRRVTCDRCKHEGPIYDSYKRGAENWYLVEVPEFSYNQSTTPVKDVCERCYKERDAYQAQMEINWWRREAIADKGAA